jgi:WD40 repeat protein
MTGRSLKNDAKEYNAMNKWRRFLEKFHRRMIEQGLLAFFLALRELALLCGLLYLYLLLDWLCRALEEWIDPQPGASAPAGSPAPSDHIGAVAFSPAVAYLAHAAGPQVRVLSLLTLSASTYEGHRDLVTSLSWSPDGTRLASGSLDGTVQVREFATGRLLFSYTRHRAPVRAVAWSPDGARLASAGADGSLHIWNASHGGVSVEAALGALGELTSLAWSPDGSCLLSGGVDGIVCLWDPETGNAMDRYSAHERAVSVVAWCPDADRLLFASAGSDGYVKVWSAERRDCLFVYLGHTRPAGSPGPTGVVACAWTFDGRRIISADLCETVQEWTPPLDDGQALVVISVPVAAFTHSRSAASVHCLDVGTLRQGQDEILTQLAVAGDGWMFIGPSPADPLSMFEDTSGGRLQPLFAMDVRHIERGS